MRPVAGQAPSRRRLCGARRGFYGTVGVGGAGRRRVGRQLQWLEQWGGRAGGDEMVGLSSRFVQPWAPRNGLKPTRSACHWSVASISAFRYTFVAICVPDIRAFIYCTSAAYFLQCRCCSWPSRTRSAQMSLSALSNVLHRSGQCYQCGVGLPCESLITPLGKV